jgi:hypothetical protein
MESQTPGAVHERPPDASDELVEAVGKVSEALEWVERARGRLYDLHQLIGRADFIFEDAANLLEEAGNSDLAQFVRTEVIGCNVLPGRWTFQIVEEFDDGYYRTVADAERRIRDELMDGKRHIHEAELKEQRRTKGLRGHEARPDEDAGQP